MNTFITRIRGGWQCLRCGHIVVTRRAAVNHITRWSPACGGPIHDCASLGGSHQPDCQLALARGTTLGRPGDFS